jgi:hypothetical protein
MASQLEPIHRSVARNLACESLAQLGPAGALAALDRVYEREALASRLVAMMRSCDSEVLAGAARKLADRAAGPRERIALLGAVLSQSLRNGKWEEARASARGLSRDSGKYPALTGHAFWSALEQGAPAGDVHSVILAYRSRARWLPVDDERQKHWFSRRAAASAEKGGYLADSVSAHSSLSIPVGLLPPAVKWPFAAPSGFYAAFKSTAQAALSSEAASGEKP